MDYLWVPWKFFEQFIEKPAFQEKTFESDKKNPVPNRYTFIFSSLAGNKVEKIQNETGSTKTSFKRILQELRLKLESLLVPLVNQ